MVTEKKNSESTEQPNRTKPSRESGSLRKLISFTSSGRNFGISRFQRARNNRRARICSRSAVTVSTRNRETRCTLKKKNRIVHNLCFLFFQCRGARVEFVSPTQRSLGVECNSCISQRRNEQFPSMVTFSDLLEDRCSL